MINKLQEPPVDDRPLTDEERQAELLRKEENLRWLMEHCDWHPFDVEW